MSATGKQPWWAEATMYGERDSILSTCFTCRVCTNGIWYLGRWDQYAHKNWCTAVDTAALAQACADAAAEPAP